MKKSAVFFLSLFFVCLAWGQNSSRSNPKDAEAQFQYGVAYIRNRTVAADVDKGIYWLKKSAEQGYIPAQTAIGELYYGGIGVHKNYHEAHKWLLVAGENGDARAQELLGTMYMFGFGVRQDEKKGVYWYKKAANPNNLSGYYYLGTVYALGLGGERRDFSKAKEYFGIGCDAGVQNSCYEYARLN